MDQPFCSLIEKLGLKVGLGNHRLCRVQILWVLEQWVWRNEIDFCFACPHYKLKANHLPPFISNIPFFHQFHHSIG